MECQLLFGVEMRSMRDLKSKPGNLAYVGVTDQPRQVQIIELLLLRRSLKILVQFVDDPVDGLPGLRQQIEIMTM